MAHWMPALQDVLYSRLTGDTGTGGLLNATTPLISGVYYSNAPEQAPMPYVLISMVGTNRQDAFRTRSILVDFEITTRVQRQFSLGQTPSTTDDGLIRGALIMERIDGDWDRQPHGTAPTYGLDRYKPTLAGSTPWTADIIEFQEARDQSGEEAFEWVQAFRVYIGRAAV